MTRFHELPDSIDSDEIKNYFIQYLIYYCNNTDITNIYYALNELLELADRQWHTYQILDSAIVYQLEKYLESIIDFDDEEIMDYILSIIPRIGMKSLFDYILENKGCIHKKSILDNVNESEIEYGCTVDNPYAKM